MTETLKISDRVLLALARLPKNRGKQWLAEQLTIGRVTLNKRFKKNTWTDQEIETLRRLNLL
jgi:hypothetical protein